PLSPAQAKVLLRARRFGAGVASFAVWRFYVILAGPSDAPEDDIALELKEERDGLIVRGVPRLAAAEWNTPAARAVDTQHRLQARPDGDDLLGAGEAGGLSLRIHSQTAYQRGVSADDIAALAGAPSTRDQVPALAHRFGAMLARAHGVALTED